MFMLFGGGCYYAAGGMNDYENTYSTLEEAVERARLLEKDGYGWDWWQVLTIRFGVLHMVARTETTPYGADDDKFVDGVQIYAREESHEQN